jgi:hypothetical protein
VNENRGAGLMLDRLSPAAFAMTFSQPHLQVVGASEERDGQELARRRSSSWPGPSGDREPPPRPRLGMTGWWLPLFVLALFAVNYWSAGRVMQRPRALQVPYSPFFLAQARAGNVASITSTVASIEGRFKHAVR